MLEAVLPERAGLLRALAVCAVLGGVGCRGSDPPREPGSDSPAAAAVTLAPWYHRERALDLTADGRADEVRLVARGTRPDSLRVTLSLLVGGEEQHREEWGSSYELALVDSADRIRPRVDTVVRAALDSVMASVVVEPLDAPGVRLLAEDSAVLAGLEPRPANRVSFSYGYETTVRLVWDVTRRRFLRLWSCC